MDNIVDEKGFQYAIDELKNVPEQWREQVKAYLDMIRLDKN